MTNQEKAEFLWNQAINTINMSNMILYRKFETTMTILQDDPDVLRKEIIKYLNEHAEHIERIELESEVDPNTFIPSIVIRMHTNIQITDNLISKLETPQIYTSIKEAFQNVRNLF